MHRRHIVLVALATGLIAAGCGSSSSSSSTQTSSKSSGGSATTAAPIKVLTYGDITGLFPVPQDDLVDGVRAAVNAFNAAGGVQGRKVQLITCDTELNPAKAASCVENAEAQGVDLAIPSFELLDSVTNPILEKQNIPIFSDPSTAKALYDPNSACFVPGPFTTFPAGVTQLAKAGVKTMSVTEPLGVPNTNNINEAVKMTAAANGMKIGAVVGVSTNATNLSSVAAQATNGGEDGAFLLASPPGLFTLIGDIAQARPGIKMSVFGPDLATPQVLAAVSKIPGGKGLYAVGETVWPTDTSVPGIRLFDKQLSSVDKAALGNGGAVPPWVDAWGAMQVLATMKSGPITPATVSAAMKKANLSFEGIVPNWHYQYNTLGLGCDNANVAYLGQYNGGSAITPANGGKPITAISPGVVAYYKKALASAASS